MAPMGPADPKYVEEYLRDVMGLTDEGLKQLDRAAEAKERAKEAASNSEKQRRRKGYRLLPEPDSEK